MEKEMSPKLLFAVFLTVILDFSSSSGAKSILEGQSFRFRCSVSTNFYSGQILKELTPVLRLQEEYCSDQDRAKVHVTKLANNGTSGLFQYDAGQRLSFLSFNSSSCVATSVYQFNQILFGDILGPLEEDLLNSVFDDENDGLYMVGSADLLNSTLSNLDKFESGPSLQGDVGEHLEYWYHNSDLNINVSAHFTNSSFTKTPYSIRIEFPEDKVISFRYYDFEFLPESVEMNTKDKFLIQNLTRLCVTSLESATDLESQTLFAESEPIKFSFRAQIILRDKTNQLPVRKLSLFVAYDEEVSSMRLDNLDKADGAKHSVRRRVMNFKEGRNYFLLGTSDNFNQCLVTRMLWGLMKEINSQSLGERLVGANKYFYLGRTSLRGQKVKKYQSYEASIPLWLEQRQDIFFQSGKLRYLSSERGVNHKLDRNCSIVIYVRDEKGNLPVPVEFELDLPKEQNKTMYDRYKVRLFDFKWDLEPEAPNGDKSVAMFALENLCYFAQKKELNQHANIRIVLESGDKEPENFRDLLGSTKERNLVLLKSLQNSLPLNVNMIYNLKSSFIFDSGWRLFVEFSAAEHTNILSEIMYIGAGSLPPEEVEKTIFVNSLQECQLLCSATTNTSGSIFAYDLYSRSCYIMSRMSHYNLHENGELSFYKIELRLDKDKNLNRMERFVNETITLIPKQQLILKSQAPSDNELKLNIRKLVLREKATFTSFNGPARGLDGEITGTSIVIIVIVMAIVLVLLLSIMIVQRNRFKKKIYFNHQNFNFDKHIQLRNIRS